VTLLVIMQIVIYVHIISGI